MFELPELKYNYADFEPFFDARTMEIHHSKHHQAYVDNLNAAVEELKNFAPDLVKKPLSELLWGIQNGEYFELFSKVGNFVLENKIRNNGGGHLNHSLFWEILKPSEDDENLPSEFLMKKFEASFLSFENFKATFKQAALGQFGSGWAWLRVNSNGNLVVDSTPNQDFWGCEQNVSILGLDVWEHAYYLNYQNRRADFVDAFWNLVDWRVVEQKFIDATEGRMVDFIEGVCVLNSCPTPELREVLLFDEENELSKNEDLALKNENELSKTGKKRILYTDGSASPNPGPGGFAIIENGEPLALGAENPSTNIRMEGLALKKALEVLNGEEAEIWTDSEFWINVLTKWAPAWQKSGWKKKSGEIKNLDIVKPLFEAYQNSNAELKWLKGHAGHEFNELADEWANKAREKGESGEF